MAAPKKKRRKFNWDAIQLDYRKGLFSNVVLGEMHGPCESAIRKKAKAEGWAKDLNPEIKRRAQEKLSASEVRGSDDNSGIRKSDEESIEEGSDLVVKIVRGHRKQIQGYQELVSTFGERLGEQIKNEKILVQVGESKGVIEIDIPLDYIGKGITSATSSLERLIRMERQSYNIDGEEKGRGGSFEDYMDELREDGHL